MKIDIHNHILPESWPNLQEVQITYQHTDYIAGMLTTDIVHFCSNDCQRPANQTVVGCTRHVPRPRSYSGWRKVPIEVYTPIGVQYPDRGIISCIFSSQKVENF